MRGITIVVSGFSKEKRERVLKALEKVGLKPHPSYFDYDADKYTNVDVGGKIYPHLLYGGTIAYTVQKPYLHTYEELLQLADMEEPKPFSKSDLLDGMRVIHRDGAKSVVLGGKLVIEGCYREVYYKKFLEYFKENLYSSEGRDMDIMKVSDRCGTVLFEREEEESVVDVKARIRKGLEELLESL